MKKNQRIKTLLFFVFILLGSTFRSEAQRSETHSLNLSRSRSGLNFETKTSGFDFYGVQFRYQFVNCGGDVQMGINYDKRANYTYYYHEGKWFGETSVGRDLWPKSTDFELQEITADLYYGNSNLGQVHLNYIVGNFAGCFGETFDVLKQVGKNPSDKLYKDNIQKLSLRNVKIIRGGPTNTSNDYKIKDKLKKI